MNEGGKLEFALIQKKPPQTRRIFTDGRKSTHRFYNFLTIGGGLRVRYLSGQNFVQFKSLPAQQSGARTLKKLGKRKRVRFFDDP
jgi:hypothetical protein